MDGQYAVVIFASEEANDDESVEVVSASWLETTEDVTLCYWPSQNASNKARKHVRPDMERWKKYKTRRVWYVDGFERAKSMREAALTTSNPENEKEDVDGVSKSTKRQQKLPARYEDSDADGESEDSTHRTQERRCSPRKQFKKSRPSANLSRPSANLSRPSANLPASPIFVTGGRSDSIKPDLRRSPKKSHLSANQQVSPTFAAGVQSASTSHSIAGTSSAGTSSLGGRRIYPSSTQSCANNGIKPSTPARKSESSIQMILTKLNRLEHNQVELKKLIQNLGNHGEIREDLPEPIKEPVTTVGELQALDARLDNNNIAFKKAMMKYLTLIGGEDAGGTLRRMMRKLATHEVWSKYNRDGRKGKLSFKKTQLYQVVIKVTLKSHGNANERDVEQLIGDFLKAAPYKKGGKKVDAPEVGGSGDAAAIVAPQVEDVEDISGGDD